MEFQLFCVKINLYFNSIFHEHFWHLNFIDLIGREKGKESSPSCSFIFQMPVPAGTGPGRSWEPGTQ